MFNSRLAFASRLLLRDIPSRTEEMMNQVGQSYGRQTPFGREQARDLPWVRVIPYDYVAEFDLKGDPGNLIQDVINVSVEGVFIAVSIGYGFEEDRVEEFELEDFVQDLTNPTRPTLGEVTLDNIPPDVLIEGFRISPDLQSVAIKNGALNDGLPFDVTQGIFQRVRPPQNITFLLSIVDSATGRELQNEPVHSVAALGRANGQRPFKALSQPMVFMPRSTVRMQVEERSRGVKGRLFITLQGYKVLGVAGNLEEAVRTLVQMDPLKKIPVYDYETGNYRTLGEAMEQDVPTTGVVPFDYVSTLDLTGRPGNIVEDEVPVNVDGGYLTLALGYSLDPGDTGVEIDLEGATIQTPGNRQRRAAIQSPAQTDDVSAALDHTGSGARDLRPRSAVCGFSGLQDSSLNSRGNHRWRQI